MTDDKLIAVLRRLDDFTGVDGAMVLTIQEVNEINAYIFSLRHELLKLGSPVGKQFEVAA